VLRGALAWLLLWHCAIGGAQASQPAGPLPAFERIEAVAGGGWDDAAPPATGWRSVTLPDDWSQRLAGHDGIVWYRLSWTEPAQGPLAARGLFLRDMTMAGVVMLNGSEIARDPQLVEPLSRSWNLPRYWRLDEPLLRPGHNELLVRVSGLADFQPGLGEVVLGSPEAVRPMFAHDQLMRRSLQWLSIGVTLVMAVLYGMLWALRRSEVSYGWFSLFSILWVLFALNYVATGPWPFGSTDAYQRASHGLMLGSVMAFFMFALSFCHVRARWPRLVAGAPVVATALALAIAPADGVAQVRSAAVLLATLIHLSACAILIGHAWRSRRTEAVVLAACLLLSAGFSLHDTLVFMRVLEGNGYYLGLCSTATLLGISFALTWRMVQGMRLVEHFNQELQARVDEASLRLAESLRHQHDAQLEQTRLAERLNLVRDLHDGLGMTLTSHLHALRADARAAQNPALWALREVSDDLRLIMENTAFDDSEDLSQRIAPLRHRSTRLLEAAGIACRWRIEQLQGCRLSSRRALDFLRVLQEALANVVKHSGATQVQVRVAAQGGELVLEVRDDGRGFVPDAPPQDAGAVAGMGLSSMRTRAQRLGGRLSIDSQAGATVLGLRCPL